MEIQLPCLELLVVALLPRNLDPIALTTDKVVLMYHGIRNIHGSYTIVRSIQCIANFVLSIRSYQEMGVTSGLQYSTTTFRQDKLVKHEHSSMHKDAERCRREEAHACASGGIRAALEVTVSRE